MPLNELPDITPPLASKKRVSRVSICRLKLYFFIYLRLHHVKDMTPPPQKKKENEINKDVFF